MPAAEVFKLNSIERCFVPILKEIRHSPYLTPEAHRCRAAKVEEQAVSILKHGPTRPRVYESRPDVIDADPPLAEKTFSQPSLLSPLGSTATPTPTSYAA